MRLRSAEPRPAGAYSSGDLGRGRGTHPIVGLPGIAHRAIPVG